MNMDEQASIPLPKLHPLITLHRAPDNADGSPMWSLHNPVSNEYFRIDWISFECLARFSFYQNSRDLIHAVNQETTLSIDEQDIESLIAFLNFHGLVALPDQRFGPQSLETNKPLWMRIFHGYLFFSLPLIKPHKFLQRTLPVVRPLLSAPFVSTMLLILIAAVITTLDRSDEFFATFTQIFTPQGIVFGLLTFAVLKIVHEFAHAYTAEKYGVSVSHMGVAFIVMYPVLYTEASGSWALSSRKHRVHIGMAGILAELCIAGIALWLWNFSNPGDVLHSLSFMVVSVSLISSLLVNLNPLMRFDGYYMFSDYTRIENLQSRACAIARYRLRQILFASREDPPEMLNARQYNLMLVFGCALIIYRFFLFTGIAALVYFLFPRPLNFLMAGAELYWFIFMPALA